MSAPLSFDPDDVARSYGEAHLIRPNVAPAASGTERTSQSSRLVELCADVELFHARDGEAYATVAVNEHLETWRVRSSMFRDMGRGRPHAPCR